MLSMFNNKYPYTDFHELNLDWLLAQMKELSQEMQDFIQLNSNIIKYADPIQWDITAQYQQYTIVEDNYIAYLSKEPVPTGIAITDTDYWLPIFDLTPILGNLTNIRDQISANYETAYTATQNYNEGDWLFIKDGDNDLLYYALTTIITNTGLVPGVNVQKVTVEDLVKMVWAGIANIRTDMGDLATLTTTDQTSLVNAINEVNGNVGDLSTLTTTDQTSAVNAINELDGDIGDLSTLTTTDKTSAVNAINEVDGDVGDLTSLTTTDQTSTVGAINELDANIGDLNDLITSDKTSIVNAINSFKAESIYFNVKDYGAVGDGVTDDTTAVQAAVADANSSHGIVFFPAGRYYITSSLVFTQNGTGVMGEGNHATYLYINHTGHAIIVGDAGTNVHGFYMANIGIINRIGEQNSRGVDLEQSINSYFANILIQDFKIGFYVMQTGNTFFYAIGIASTVANARGFIVGKRSVSTAIHDCYVGFTGAALTNGIGLSATIGRVADLLVNYLDVGNGAVGVYMVGNDYPADLQPSTDIRLIDIVVDGSRTAGIQLEHFNTVNGVLIHGGWINPNKTNNNPCIRLNDAPGVTISNVHMQQLAIDVAPILYGVYATNSPNLQIIGNRFTNIRTPIMLTSGTNNTVIANNSIISPDPSTLSASTYDIQYSSSNNVIVNGNLSNTVNAGFLSKVTSSYSMITNNITRNKTNSPSTIITGTGATDVVDNNIIDA